MLSSWSTRRKKQEENCNDGVDKKRHRQGQVVQPDKPRKMFVGSSITPERPDSSAKGAPGHRRTPPITSPNSNQKKKRYWPSGHCLRSSAWRFLTLRSLRSFGLGSREPDSTNGLWSVLLRLEKIVSSRGCRPVLEHQLLKEFAQPQGFVSPNFPRSGVALQSLT